MTLAFAPPRRVRSWAGWGWLARWAPAPGAFAPGAFAPGATAEPAADWLDRDELGPFVARTGGGAPTLVEVYHSRRLGLVRLALLLVDDLPTAEDVVQDAFTAVYRRHGAVLSRVENVGGYLHTAVVNAARSVLRRRRTVRAAPPRVEYSPATDERLLLAEEHREVLDALRRLPRRQREVLVLRYWSELTETQIAAALSISRGTVKSTASRALVALEQQLAGREANR